jgi:site-specific DNA recombinase
MKKTRVIIYARVSTSGQDLKSQLTEIENHCLQNNYEIVKEITEKISGTKKWRDRELKEVFGEEDYDGIVVSEVSRLGRNTADVLDIIEDLTKQKKWVEFKSEKVKTLDPDGRENYNAQIMLAILSSLAQTERKLIIERSSRGMTSSVREGNWTGGKYLPYGYKRVEKRLVIDEEEATIVRKIFQWHSEGYGTTRIAKILNTQRVETRYNKSVESVKINGLTREGSSFKWASGTIYSILKNEVYVGTKKGNKLLKGLSLSSPPIITKDVFDLAQIRLKNNTSRTSVLYRHMLNKKTKCGVCGRTYYPHKRASNKDNAYKCLSKRYGEHCDNYGIGIPRLNNAIWTILRTSQDELENILEFHKNKSGLKEEIQVLENKIGHIRQEIEEEEKKELKIIDLYLSESFEKTVLESKQQSIKNQILSLTSEQDSLKSELTEKKDLLNKQTIASDQLKRIKEDVLLLEQTLQQVLKKVVIYPVLLNSIQGVFPNKQDKLVLIEMTTFLNTDTPISFVISQRTKMILLIEKEKVSYDKKTKTLSLVTKEQFGEEEEDVPPVYTQMIEIENLTKTLYKRKDKTRDKV